jgi:hypothetical protein
MAFILGFRVWLVYREKSDLEAGFRNLKASERGNEMWHGLGLNWGLTNAFRGIFQSFGLSKKFRIFFALKLWRAKNG